MSEPHDGPDATWLIGQMYDYEVTLYGPAPGGQFPPLRWVEGRSAFLVARVGTRPVGCGAIIPFEADVAEVKRVYVESAWRRQGVARAILEELARRALAFGYRELRLETGILQQEAMALYAAAGFRRIACYGNHRDDPLSACYSKVLSAEERLWLVCRKAVGAAAQEAARDSARPNRAAPAVRPTSAPRRRRTKL